MTKALTRPDSIATSGGAQRINRFQGLELLGSSMNPADREFGVLWSSLERAALESGALTIEARDKTGSPATR
ncbi:uncharacterized protein N7511_005505 [Penicillium nucicola]|uniref:uncharacterized protein n=1 Tax=Penicillium nucicola TaxID=1850975 RepID=UPI002544F02F|nr:uncharacterized protein N7511_005505 [Penicillium nucicola]KAJ5762123.1 hypothetical protein N7511_005505 [Penicillium nucicola]